MRCGVWGGGGGAWCMFYIEDVGLQFGSKRSDVLSTPQQSQGEFRYNSTQNFAGKQPAASCDALVFQL